MKTAIHIICMLMMILILSSTDAHAAKAAAVITSVTAGPAGSQTVGIMCQMNDSGGSVGIFVGFTVNFASSTNQMNTDLKIRIRDVLAEYGVILGVNDIVIFGGAQ